MTQTVLTVFLSSTAKDLTAFRNAVHARLSKLEYFRCIWQEHFDAQDAQAYDYCRDEAKKADIYIGLIGMRRGWEPKQDTANRSITELEHDWAEEAGRPRLIYVAPDTFPVPGNLHESKAEHRRQLAFRQRMMVERVVSQAGFESPDLLAATIAERVLRLVIDNDRKQLMASKAEQAETLPDAIAERIAALLEAHGDAKKAEQAGVESKTIIELARRLKPEEALDIDQALKELDAAVQVAADVMKKGGQIGNFDDIVSSVRVNIAKKTAAGDLDGARREADRGFAEWERAEVSRHQVVLRSGIAILEAGLEQDILRRDAVGAAKRIHRMVKLEHLEDVDTQFKALHARQIEFYERGRDKGINFDLEVAIEISRNELSTATNEQRGTALNDLGSSLWRLGERESGTARLEQAIDIHRASLLEQTRERVPLHWAMIQNNLGNALRSLGERESGTERLEKAVEAYRAALLEYTREHLPFAWAMTQNNLGNAFWTLGQRERGTARLEQAVEAYRAALLERTRERMPLEWALTQNNLGTALWTLGEREGGTARLEESIEAHRAALLERTRERVPLSWALTQNNLGTALSILGERESGTGRLEEAVEAFHAALLEYTRERVPLDWAMSTGNQGNALMHLAERRMNHALADQAVQQLEAALAVSKEGGHAANAAYYEAQLRKARALRDLLSQQ